MNFAGTFKAAGRRAAVKGALACAAAAAAAFALSAGAAGARQGGAASQPAPAARRVNVWFDVTDKLGLQVKSLRAEDVRVVDDGAQRRVESLELRPAGPRAIIIALDTSVSQENILPAEKLIAQALVARLVRAGAADSVAVVSFAHETTLEQDFTQDAALARRAVGNLRAETPSGYVAGAILAGRDQVRVGSTSLADALWLVGGEVFPATPPDARRVLVLLSDGQDTSSQKKQQDAAASLLAAGATVFAFGLSDPNGFTEVDKRGLRSLAERTGGRAFFPKKDPDVIAALDSIEQTLGAQYLLTYTPAAADPKEKTPKLKIEIVNPELRARGLRVNHAERRPALRP